MRIQAIIFDYDGVLTHGAQRPNEYALAEEGLRLAQGELYRRLWDGDAWQRVKRGELLEAEFWRSVLPTCGLEPRDAPYGPLQFLLRERLDEDVMAVARCLRPDYQMALLSNATLSYEQRWLEFGLFELFDVVVNSARVGMAKPDSEIYRLTLDWLGRAPDECLFIDDKPRNTRAAEALGIPSIAFTNAEALNARLVEMSVLAPPERRTMTQDGRGVGGDPSPKAAQELHARQSRRAAVRRRRGDSSLRCSELSRLRVLRCRGVVWRRRRSFARGSG